MTRVSPQEKMLSKCKAVRLYILVRNKQAAAIKKCFFCRKLAANACKWPTRYDFTPGTPGSMPCDTHPYPQRTSTCTISSVTGHSFPGQLARIATLVKPLGQAVVIIVYPSPPQYMPPFLSRIHSVNSILPRPIDFHRVLPTHALLQPPRMHI